MIQLLLRGGGSAQGLGVKDLGILVQAANAGKPNGTKTMQNDMEAGFT